MEKYNQRARAKKYIGSAVNLKSRMNHYFSIKHLFNNNTMAICRALKAWSAQAAPPGFAY
jgi:excinuclease UvrABC nuclease subunit